MKKVFKLLFLVMLFLTSEVMAATCTSKASGNWDSSTTWNCTAGTTPATGDTVILASPYTVSLNNNDRTVASLTIDAGATLNDDNQNLIVNGNVVNNGTFGTNGGALRMRSANATLSGSGTFNDTDVEIDATGISLPVGSTLNFTNQAQLRVGNNNTATFTLNGAITGTGLASGDRILRVYQNSSATINGSITAANAYIRVEQNASVTNNGTVSVQYLDSDGNNSTAVWTQGANSALTVSQTPTNNWRGTLNASATGNTVTYNSPAAPLTPSANTYYNLAGTGVSCPHGFTVLGSSPCGAVTPPSVTTNAATSVSATGATLNGTVSSNGGSTTVTFDYGLTAAYGSTATAAQSPLASGASGSAVSAAVSGLTCESTYHFRVKGVNGGGTSNGGDLTFTTSTCPPPAITATASPSNCINVTGIGNLAWGNPSRAFASDNSYATVSINDNQTSNFLQCTGYGFSIPTGSTINGITVSVERKADTSANITDAAMRVVKGGVIQATDRSTATQYPTTDTYENHGGAADLWGSAWTVADINSANFGAAFAAQKPGTSGGARAVSVDHMRITIDYTPPLWPVVSSINRADPSPTTATSVSWTVVFSASVTGVDASDFVLAASGLSGAAITAVTGSGTTWTVTADTGTGGGTLGLNLVDDDTIVDASARKLGGTGVGNGDFSGQVYSFPVPTVTSINRASFDPASTNTAVSWTVTFSVSVTGVDVADFTLIPSGGVSGATLTSVSGSGTTWTVTANTGSGTTGTLGLNLADNDTIMGGAIPLGGTGIGNGNFSGQAYTILASTCTGAANVIFCDDFERTSPGALGNGWTVTPSAGANCTGTAGNTGCSGIDSDIPPFNTYSNPRANPTRSMFTRWQPVSVDSPVINLAGRPAALLSFWMRRGSDTFSECPEAAGENYLVEFWDGAAWQILSQYPSSPSAGLCGDGPVWTPVIQLPPSALHAGFKLRFYQPSGSGRSGSGGAPGVVGYDYWHMDNVVITEAPTSSYVGAFCDTFEAGTGRWSFTAEEAPANASIGDASLNTTDFQSASHELDMRWGYVVASTLRTDMTGISGNISYWLKSGGGTTNRAPDAGENLAVEYFNSAGVWTSLATHAANSSTTSTIYNGSYAIPADAKHTGFRLRFRQLAGSGYDTDYWHLDDVCVGSGIPTADLSISKTRSLPLVRGSSAAYTLTVTNHGPGTLAGSLEVSDTLPAGLTYLSATGSGWTCTASGSTITCGWSGTVANGASAPPITLTVNVAADASGTITNTAAVTGTVIDGTPGNDSASDSYTFPVADISLSMTSPALTPGSNAVYTLTVDNAGPDAEPGSITLVDTLPSGLSFVSGVGTNWSCSAFGQQVTCTLTGPLASGASSTLTLSSAVASIAAGMLTNTATVTGIGIDPDLTNNSASASYTINATLVAKYHLDESGWNGSAGELEDTAGYSGGPYNGTATGNSNPTSSIANPALPGSPGTCSYATLSGPANNGSAFVVNGLPVSTSNGGKSSLSFWMYWDGTDNVMPVGWNQYSLMLANGYIGFHTGNNDLFGVASTGLANGWHHVAVMFANGSVVNNELYLDGVAQTLAQIQGTPTLANAVAATTLHIGGWGTDSGYRFSGRMDEVRAYRGVLSADDVASLYGATHACVAAVDHLEIQHATGAGLTCAASRLTIQACANADCSTPYTGGISGTLSATGMTVNWDGSTGNAAGAGFTIPTGNSSVTKDVQVATAGGVTFGIVDSPTPAPSNAAKCNFGTNLLFHDNCVFTADTAGFIFSDSPTGNTNYTIPALTSGAATITDNLLWLRAVQASTANAAVCSPAIISQTVDVSMGYLCNDPATCQTGSLGVINGTAIAPTGSAVSLAFDANGSAKLTSLRYDDVGAITFTAEKTVTPFGGGSAVTLNGTSNTFVVQPHHFDLSGIKRTSDNVANPGAADAADTCAGASTTDCKFVRAGEQFSVTVTAKNALGGTTKNYGQETAPESVKLTSTLVPGLGLTNNPVLGGNFGAFSDGVASGTNFTWNEVGIITLTPSVADAHYLSEGDNTTGTASGNVGRFYPDHFAISNNSIANRTDIAACALFGCGAYTYMGEQMNALFTLTAMTVGGAPTSNYAGAFAYLDPTAFAALNMGAVDRTTNPAAHALLTGRISVAGMPAVTCSTAPCFLAGVANVTAPFMMTRPVAPDGPYTVALGINPADADGVTVPFGIDISSVAAPLTNDRGSVGVTNLRHGRIKLSNAYGSELLPLAVSATAQFWDGTRYTTSIDDSLTSFLNSEVNISGTLLHGGSTAVSPNSVVLVNGVRNFNLSAPGTGRTGRLNLTTSAPSYLPSTTGTATFGVYQGNNNFIYQRENY